MDQTLKFLYLTNSYTLWANGQAFKGQSKNHCTKLNYLKLNNDVTNCFSSGVQK